MDRRTIPAWLWMKAEDVVDASLEGLAAGKLIVIPGDFYKFLAKLEEWMPRGLRDALALRYGKKSGRTASAK
jgi:short-subunit dehydrogenase